MSITDLPNELVVKIFGYLDGFSLNNVMKTCKLWNELANSAPIWESLCISYLNQSSLCPKIKLRLSNGKRQMIRDSGGLGRSDPQTNPLSRKPDQGKDEILKSEGFSIKKYLPTEDEIRHFIRASESLIDDWRFVYRFLSTCLIVDCEVDDTDQVNSEFYTNSRHKPLLRTRIFKTIKDAINACEEGGIIYIKKGRYNEELTIEKTVHLYGEMSEDTRIYLRAKILNTIKWKAPNGTITCLNFTTNDESCKSSLDVFGSVEVGCSLFKNLTNTGLRVRSKASVDVIDSHFSGCVKPIRLDEDYLGFNTSGTLFKDLVEPDQIETILRKLFENESQESVISCIHFLTLLQRSDANRAHVSTILNPKLKDIVIILESYIGEVSVQEEFCIFVEETLKKSDAQTDIDSIINPIVEIAFTVLSSQLHNTMLQRIACLIVGRIAMHESSHPVLKARKMYIPLANLMNYYINDYNILKDVLGSLWNVVWLSHDAKLYLSEGQSFSLIIKSLDAYHHIEVLICTCGILWNLSSIESVSEKIVEAKVIDKIVNLMRTWSNNDTFLSERFHWISCSVLNNLVDHPEGKRALENIDGIFHAIEAYKKYSKSKRIHEKVDALCKKMYYDDESFHHFVKKRYDAVVTLETVYQYCIEKRQVGHDIISSNLRNLTLNEE